MNLAELLGYAVLAGAFVVGLWMALGALMVTFDGTPKKK